MRPFQRLFSVSVMAMVGTVSQAQVSLEGRVYSKNGDVSATHVLNTTSNRATITTADGFFDIEVHLNDTLVFSAVQFKKKEIVVTASILESKLLVVPLEEVLTQLEEVVVTPYSLTGDMSRDLNRVPVGSIITARSLGLENKRAINRKGMGETFRLNKYLNLVTGYDTITLAMKVRFDLKIVKLSEDISGKTKDLKKYATLEKEVRQIDEIRLFFTDFVFLNILKIQEEQINDFLNYCMIDADFKELANADDMASLYKLMSQKSLVYRKNNGLD